MFTKGDASLESSTHFLQNNLSSMKSITKGTCGGHRKLSSWIGKLLSYGNRLILINSMLTSLPMVMLYFLEISKEVRKILDYYRSRFIWQSDGHKTKYRLTKWNIICRPKDQGGLGIEVLELKKIA
jgi:hypothetical protein